MNKPVLLYAGLATTVVVAGLLVAGVIPMPFKAAGAAPVSLLTSASGDWQWNLPKGFPEPLVPADNPMSEAKFQLGRHLFFDKRLSGTARWVAGPAIFRIWRLPTAKRWQPARPATARRAVQ